MTQINNNQKPITYAKYKRKSTDEKDRQILSLESQENETKRMFGNLKTITLPEESVSAFKPYKRPIFDDMIKRIEKGEVQGIISWHPDRLSRNPIEAAQIIYFLDTGKLKDLKFCSYHFDNSPEGKMMLNMTMSQSKYSSDKLSVDVKRGMDKKASTGWRPGSAPLGYLNSKTNLKGQQVIYTDKLRFSRVKKMWQMLLSENYTVAKIFTIANEKWKLTMPATGKKPERKLRLSGFYRIFDNPFYYGWYEWPVGSDNWIKGNHDPMVTEADFNKAQRILGRKGKPRDTTHKFAFTGLMRCSSCGAMITAEKKFKKQKNGAVHDYTYYHCTRRKDTGCKERGIELKNFSKQVDDIVSKLTISEKFKDWSIQYLHDVTKNEATANEEVLLAKHKRLENIVKQLDNLLLSYTSPENSNGQIMTNEEYSKLRSALLKEKNDIETELNSMGQQIEKWQELSEKTFTFARYAQIWFDNGDLDTKRAILACLGSNPSIKGKILTIPLKKPFKMILEGLPGTIEELSRLEPLKIPQNSREFGKFVLNFPILSGRAESNRHLNLGKVT